MTNGARQLDLLQMENARLRNRVDELEQELERVKTVLLAPDEEKNRYITTLEERIAERNAQFGQQAAALRQNEMLLQAILDNAPFLISVKDLEGRFLIINRQIEVILNLKAAQVIGKTDHAIFSQEMAERSRKADQEAFKTRTSIEREDPLVDINGVLRYYLSVRFPLYDESDDPFALCNISTDITERKQAEDELRESEKWFRQLTMALLDSVVVIEGGQIIEANQPAAAMFGYHLYEFIGLDFLEIVAEESRHLVHEYITTGYDKPYEATLLRKDGSTFPAEVRSRLVNYRGRMVGITTARDLIDLRQAEMERAALQQQVIEAQQAAIRELSTPLLPLADNVIALPLVGVVDSARTQQLMETLLEGIAHYQADIAILDITGVKVVDTQVAQALIYTAQAVKLLGAQMVITGIQPQIAQTLVQLGVDLGTIVTCSTLQSGIVYALAKSE